MGVHVLDSVWWLLGMPKPVSVMGVSGAKFGPRGQGYWHFRPQKEEFYTPVRRRRLCAVGSSALRTALGLQVECFWASHQPSELQIELFGTEAGAQLQPLTLYKTENGAPIDSVVETDSHGQTSWDTLAGHFIDCILDGVECDAPLRHGLIVQRMMEALLRSAETGREVRLD